MFFSLRTMEFRERSEEEEEFDKVLGAVKRGDEKAKTRYAWFKLSGRGEAFVDADEAVAFLTERVKDKDAEAMWMLGVCKELGIGMEEDKEGAGKLYKLSSECGNATGKVLVSKWRNGKGDIIRLKSS